MVSPFVQAVYYSLTDWTGFSPTMNFVGLANYVKLFDDDIFLKAVRQQHRAGARRCPLVTLVLALIFATLVTVGGASPARVRGLRDSSFYRVVRSSRTSIPAIVIGMIWSQIYDPNSGLLNGILTGIGLDQAQLVRLARRRCAPPCSPSMFVIVWGLVGFYMVLFIAAIKGIPAEVYEAARVDGAGRFRTRGLDHACR